MLPDAGGDTEPATDTEETYVATGSKRKAGGSARPVSKSVLNYFHHVPTLTTRFQVKAIASNGSV